MPHAASTLASAPLSPTCLLNSSTHSPPPFRCRTLPPAPPPAVGRMYTKAGQAYDQGTALAADLKIKPSADETARVRPAGAALCCTKAELRWAAAAPGPRPVVCLFLLAPTPVSMLPGPPPSA